MDLHFLFDKNSRHTRVTTEIYGSRLQRVTPTANWFTL